MEVASVILIRLFTGRGMEVRWRMSLVGSGGKEICILAPDQLEEKTHWGRRIQEFGV